MARGHSELSGSPPPITPPPSHPDMYYKIMFLGAVTLTDAILDGVAVNLFPPLALQADFQAPPGLLLSIIPGEHESHPSLTSVVATAVADNEISH